MIAFAGNWFDVYAMAIGLFWLVLACYLIVNRRKVKYLRDVKIDLNLSTTVAIIIPVRNEEATIEEALRSVCQLRYSHFRIIVVNDRSTDNTSEILQKVAASFANVTILNIHELPEGWLGKNHALHEGFKLTSESWLLFTDADVNFQCDTLAKSIAYVTEHHLDHLTVLPAVKSRSEILNAALGTFVLMLELRQRPWAVRNKRSDASLGVGAFNMVKREAYIKAGTHQIIAMRPDDDLKLAEVIKQSGGVSDAVYGEDQIGLEWYTSLSEFVNGLMKNTFSIFNYRWWVMLFVGLLPTFLFFVSPLLFVFGGGATRLSLFTVMLSHAIIFFTNRGVAIRWWHFLTVPFTGLLMIYILLRSSVKTLWQGGIYWRESFYPLDKLRKE